MEGGNGGHVGKIDHGAVKSQKLGGGLGYSQASAP